MLFYDSFLQRFYPPLSAGANLQRQSPPIPLRPTVTSVRPNSRKHPAEVRRSKYFPWSSFLSLQSIAVLATEFLHRSRRSCQEMGQPEIPRRISDKCAWNQIYRALKEMLKTQRSQIETLIDDRQLLEDSLHSQHEWWRSRSQFLESHIAQTKEQQAKTRLVDDAKMGAIVGFKESEAMFYKKQLELAESDLEDLWTCMKQASAEMVELKEKIKAFEASENADYISNDTGMDQSVLSLKKDIKKLKHAYSELSSKKESQVTALLAEKDFVWNQFKKMEEDYNVILKSMRAGAENDKKVMEKLQIRVEELVLSNNEKDIVIARLEAKTGILVLDAKKHAEEAEQFGNEKAKIVREMDEHRLAAMEKDELIAKLREDLRNIRGDSKKGVLEKLKGKAKSEGKSKDTPSTTIRQVQGEFMKRSLVKCETSANYKRRRSSHANFETPEPKEDYRQHQDLKMKRERSISSAGRQTSLFRSDFKIPKLKPNYLPSLPLRIN